MQHMFASRHRLITLFIHDGVDTFGIGLLLKTDIVDTYFLQITNAVHLMFCNMNDYIHNQYQ